jgi:DNA repair ATPase RecN
MEHKRTNAGKQNENTITGRTLIESSPELSKHKNEPAKYFKRSLLDPFIKNMDYLQEHCGLEWNFQELEQTPSGHWQEKKPTTSEELLNAKIEFEVTNYPEKKLDSLRAKKEKFSSAERELKKIKREKKKIEEGIGELYEVIGEGIEAVQSIKKAAKKLNSNEKPN